MSRQWAGSNKDRPFAESRELVAGSSIWEVKDMDEARLEPACLRRGLGRKCGVTAGETHQAIERNP